MLFVPVFKKSCIDTCYADSSFLTTLPVFATSDRLDLQLYYLKYKENWITQANVVRNRMGRWKRGFVCAHILSMTPNTPVDRTSATQPISSLPIITLSTCTITCHYK